MRHQPVACSQRMPPSVVGMQTEDHSVAPRGQWPQVDEPEILLGDERLPLYVVTPLAPGDECCA